MVLHKGELILQLRHNWIYAFAFKKSLENRRYYRETFYLISEKFTEDTLILNKDKRSTYISVLTWKLIQHFSEYLKQLATNR